MKRAKYFPPVFLQTLWLLCALSLALPAMAQDDAAVGRVSALEGVAVVIRAGAMQPLAVGDAVRVSDTIQTRELALVEIQMTDGSRFTLDENTRAVLSEYVVEAQPSGLMDLIRGRLRSLISGTFSQRADSFQVVTKEGVMGVQGTEFLVEAVFNESRVYVYSGVVAVTSRDPAYPQPQILRAGQFTRVRPGEPVEAPVDFITAPDAAADGLLGSGGAQDIQSGGDQSLDPAALAPPAPEVVLPPEPNPPSRDDNNGR